MNQWEMLQRIILRWDALDPHESSVFLETRPWLSDSVEAYANEPRDRTATLGRDAAYGLVEVACTCDHMAY